MPRIRNYAGRGDAGKPLSHGRPKSTFTSHELKYGLVLALGTLVGASFCAALYSEATTTPEGSMLTPTPVDCSPRVLLHKIFSTSQPDQEIYHDSDLSLIIKPHAADLELKFADGQETTIDLHLENPVAETHHPNPDCPGTSDTIKGELPYGDGSTEVTITREISH